MGRINAIDGLRGLCLLFMTITHLEFGHEFLLGYVHFKHLGFADSAQAFIFLSGLLVGLVGMRQHLRGGHAPVARRYRRRALELYGWHLGLLLVILGASRLLPDAWSAWGDWLHHLFEDGRAYAGAAATLIYQPVFLDILPQYMLYLLAAPVLIRLAADGRAGVALAGVVVLWLVAQIGLHQPAVARIERAIFIGGTDVVLRSAFNPLGWQLAFNGGLLLGALAERGHLRVDRLFPRDDRTLPQLAAGVLFGLMALRLASTAGFLDEATAARIADLGRKQDLGLLTVLSFAAWAYLAGWLLVVAPEAADGRLRAVGLALRRAVGQPWLVVLGRHALPVFCLHVLLCYALRYAYVRLDGIPDPWFSLSVLGVLASLYLLALLLDRRRRAAVIEPAVRPS